MPAARGATAWWMKKALASVLFGGFVLLVTPAVGDETAPVSVPTTPTQAEEKAVQAFGDDNASCQEWTDGCVVCTRTAGAPACSVPGIACQPGSVRCSAPIAAPASK
jgi:hypothetical protein